MEAGYFTSIHFVSFSIYAPPPFFILHIMSENNIDTLYNMLVDFLHEDRPTDTPSAVLNYSWELRARVKKIYDFAFEQGYQQGIDETIDIDIKDED